MCPCHDHQWEKHANSSSQPCFIAFRLIDFTGASCPSSLRALVSTNCIPWEDGILTQDWASACAYVAQKFTVTVKKPCPRVFAVPAREPTWETRWAWNWNQTAERRRSIGGGCCEVGYHTTALTFIVIVISHPACNIGSTEVSFLPRLAFEIRTFPLPPGIACIGKRILVTDKTPLKFAACSRRILGVVVCRTRSSPSRHCWLAMWLLLLSKTDRGGGGGGSVGKSVISFVGGVGKARWWVLVLVSLAGGWTGGLVLLQYCVQHVIRHRLGMRMPHSHDNIIVSSSSNNVAVVGSMEVRLRTSDFGLRASDFGDMTISRS